jgi:cytochrome c556
MSRRFGLVVAVFAVAAAPLAVVAAHDESGATEAQKARHHHFHELGDAFKVVRDQTKAASPDFALIEKNAQIVQTATVDQGKWFAKGTGPETGKTRALGEIWKNSKDFEAAQKMFADKAPALLAAAKAKDIAAVRTSFGDVGKSCKNCHDTFRAPEEKE